MVKVSDLPRDLVEEILCRIPLTSLRRIRSTSKNWNSLSKDGSFTKKHLARSSTREGVIFLMNYEICLMSINLNEFDPSISPRGKLISLNDSDQLKITHVYHCEGLLLCVTQDYTRLVVWNPYSGQTLWICLPPIPADLRGFFYVYALGYHKTKSCRSHKILRYIQVESLGRTESSVFELYDVNSSLWRALDVHPEDWEVECTNHGLSLKGNTYWFATDKESRGDVPDFLLCFDFTSESFAPRLPLPFASYAEDAVILSSVREEQLAVLFQNSDTLEMEVWVTTEIEPRAVSWTKLLEVDLMPLNRFHFWSGRSFLVDEEHRAVAVLQQHGLSNLAIIIKANGYLREVDLGKVTSSNDFFPHTSSYVPSSVPITLPAFDTQIDY